MGKIRQLKNGRSTGQYIIKNLREVLYGFEHVVNYLLLIVNIQEMRKTAYQKLYGQNKNTLTRLKEERIIETYKLQMKK